MEEILGDQGNSVIATPDPEISEHYVWKQVIVKLIFWRKNFQVLLFNSFKSMCTDPIF